MKANPDSDSRKNGWIRIRIQIRIRNATWGLLLPVGFESGFGFEVTGSRFGFGFNKKEMVGSDSSRFGFEVYGFGSGFGFEMSGFAYHWYIMMKTLVLSLTLKPLLSFDFASVPNATTPINGSLVNPCFLFNRLQKI